MGFFIPLSGSNRGDGRGWRGRIGLVTGLYGDKKFPFQLGISYDGGVLGKGFKAWGVAYVVSVLG